MAHTKKWVLTFFTLLLLMVGASACSMPATASPGAPVSAKQPTPISPLAATQPTVSIAEGAASSGIQPSGIQPAPQITPTLQAYSPQSPLPTPSSQPPAPTTTAPSGGQQPATLQITRVEALPNPVYYGTCGGGQPTTLRVKAWVNDLNLVSQMQVGYEYPTAPSAPGQAMLMFPDSSGVYVVDLDQLALGADSRLQGGSGEVLIMVSAYDKQQNYITANPARVTVQPCTAGGPPPV